MMRAAHYTSWFLAMVLTICSSLTAQATESVENQTGADMDTAAESNEVVAVEPDQNEFDVNRQDVRSISISPDGKFLAAGGHDMTLRMWDMETCKLLKVIDLKFVGLQDNWRPSDVMSVAFSPDGKHLAAGSRDRTVRIWDLNPMFLLRVKESQKLTASQGGIRAIAWSPDGKYLAASGHEQIIRLWRMGEPMSEVGTLTGHSALYGYGVNSLAFEPGGHILLSGGSDGVVRLWDSHAMKQIKQFDAPNDVLGVAFSPDGKLVAAAVSGPKNSVLIWALETGKLLHKFQLREEPWAVSFSPDGKLLASNGNWSSTLIWDVTTGEMNQKLTEDSMQGGGLRAVKFTPDGQSLVTGGGSQGTPHLWNLKTGKLVKVFRKSGCTP